MSQLVQSVCPMPCCFGTKACRRHGFLLTGAWLQAQAQSLAPGSGSQDTMDSDLHPPVHPLPQAPHPVHPWESVYLGSSLPAHPRRPAPKPYFGGHSSDLPGTTDHCHRLSSPENTLWDRDVGASLSESAFQQGPRIWNGPRGVEMQRSSRGDPSRSCREARVPSAVYTPTSTTQRMQVQGEGARHRREAMCPRSHGVKLGTNSNPDGQSPRFNPNNHVNGEHLQVCLLCWTLYWTPSVSYMVYLPTLRSRAIVDRQRNPASEMISNLLMVIQLINGDLSPGSLIPEPLHDKATVTNWTLVPCPGACR